MDLVGLTNLARDVGILGISFLVIWALLTERLIPKARLDEMRQQRDDAMHELQRERDRHERAG